MTLKPVSRDTWTAGPTPLFADWTQSNAVHIFASASSVALMEASSAVGAL